MKGDSAAKSIDGIRRAKRTRPVNAGRQPVASYRHYNHDTDSSDSTDNLASTAEIAETDIVDTADKDTIAKPAETHRVVPDADIEASLDAIGDIDDDMPESANTPPTRSGQHRPVAKHSRSKLAKHKKKWSRGKKIALAIGIIILIMLIAVGVYAYTILGKVSDIFEGNPTDILTPIALQEDDNGRSNILIFGTSEDDEGHSGAQLADSILVLSVDQNNNKAAMFSIPRDLWIDYGMACSVGYSGKINATYLCGLEANNNDEKAASQYFANTVGNVLNMSIPYYIKVNYGAVSGITDALGGIDVDVYSDDPRGLYDVRTGLNLQPGVNHLNGEQALLLARARNSKGGYGLSRSNFDREKNQQRIIQALQQKALSLGVLANPQQALSILDSLGENIRTNITMSELRQILDIALAMGGNQIKSIDLTDLLTTGTVGSASVVLPTSGQGNFTELQNYLSQQLTASEDSDGAN